MKTLLKITIGAFFGLAVAAICFHGGLERAARESLRRRESFTTTVMFQPITVEYASNRQVNVAIARGIGMRSIKKDWNKSQIAGEYLGGRSKEVAGGFLRGLFSTPKHTK